ncbi:27241_t:CDS:2 [Gigaspora margarita]|uniref:27241_t:CDS:1 n=1 Tax=Gigaspora margarita TaxID=4874 RepID=A0ABM8VVI7_GIGMA|nr:27241_t:CDS:2 [Gigaspora margarita]
MTISKKKTNEEIITMPLDSEEEKIFHQVITGYLIKNNLSEAEIANRLGLDKNAVARLLRGYVESFSSDSLIAYVDKLHLPLQVKITEEINSAKQSKLIDRHF